MSSRTTIFRCMILTCLVLSPVAALATNPQFSAIYVFGDSYCDVGNIYAATGGAEPAAPYFGGRFSNGPLWLEHVANAWGLPMKPSLLGGNDYAFGGAEVTADVPLGGPNFIPSIPHQVAKYLSDHGGKADPNALYVLEGGGNDIVNATGGSPQQLAYQIAAGIAGVENQLRRAGARNFLVPNIFDLALTPIGKANAAFNTATAIATNKAVGDMLEVEALFPRVHITQLDSFDLFNAILKTDPTNFGFTDPVNPCFNQVTLTLCSDPAHTFFWDDIHPTVFGHSFLAVTVEALYAH
jgi:phospholipase/lecithinase/hemolysin